MTATAGRKKGHAQPTSEGSTSHLHPGLGPALNPTPTILPSVLLSSSAGIASSPTLDPSSAQTRLMPPWRGPTPARVGSSLNPATLQPEARAPSWAGRAWTYRGHPEGIVVGHDDDGGQVLSTQPSQPSL